MGGGGEGLELAFEFGGGGVDLGDIIAGDCVADGFDLFLKRGLEFGGCFVTEFAELFLDGKGEVLGLVDGIDFLDALAVFFGVGFGVIFGFFDLFFGEAGGTLNGDFLLLAGLLVLGGDVEDAVRVDVEGDLDLRLAAAGGGDAIELEVSE